MSDGKPNVRTKYTCVGIGDVTFTYDR